MNGIYSARLKPAENRVVQLLWPRATQIVQDNSVRLETPNPHQKLQDVQVDLMLREVFRRYTFNLSLAPGETTQAVDAELLRGSHPYLSGSGLDNARITPTPETIHHAAFQALTEFNGAHSELLDTLMALDRSQS